MNPSTSYSQVDKTGNALFVRNCSSLDEFGALVLTGPLRSFITAWATGSSMHTKACFSVGLFVSQCQSVASVTSAYCSSGPLRGRFLVCFRSVFWFSVFDHPSSSHLFPRALRGGESSSAQPRGPFALKMQTRIRPKWLWTLYGFIAM
jgi:hypothetical protein